MKKIFLMKKKILSNKETEKLQKTVAQMRKEY